jgi:environmental stress-induced protein Ves
MEVHRFHVAQLPAMPWKNGGGTTREIACVPAGAGLDAFDWRVSIAQIGASGPFSAFPGIDRVITLLDGGGVRLRGRDGAIDRRLDTPLQPFTFSGDVAIDAELLAGECHDLNVMTRRGRSNAQVQVLRASEVLPSAAGGVLLALHGEWQAAADGKAQALVAQQGLWWHGAVASWRLHADATAILLAILVHQRA